MPRSNGRPGSGTAEFRPAPPLPPVTCRDWDIFALMLRARAIVTLTLALSGCPAPTPEMAATPATIDEACANYATTYCSRGLECEGSAFSFFHGAMDVCARTVALDCVHRAGLPGSAWTVGAAQSCASARASASCVEWRFDDLLCPRVKGMRQPGSGCASSAQCDSGWCDFGSSRCGKCLPLAAAGATCGLGVAECPSGSRCDAGSHICVPRPGPSAPCQEFFSCTGGTVCLSGTCSMPPQAREGEPCTGAFCDATQDLTCGGPANAAVCRKTVVIDVGQPCDATPYALTVCRGGVCLPDPASICTALLPENASCDGTVPCANPFWCVTPAGASGTVAMPATCRLRPDAVCD